MKHLIFGVYLVIGLVASLLLAGIAAVFSIIWLIVQTLAVFLAFSFVTGRLIFGYVSYKLSQRKSKP